MSYDVSMLEPKIRALLSAPDVDLATISAKRVRKLLMEVESTLTPEVVKVNKEEINTLISQVFSEISGAQQDSEDDARSNKQKTEEGENADEDTGEVHKAPKKRRVESVQEENDAKLARKLSSEINGRATRGAGKNQIKRATKKGGRAKKSASAVGSDDEASVNGQKKKRGGGGFGKEYDLSEPLSNLLDCSKSSRPQVVKGIWGHIKRNKLQNPDNKREIICDERLKAVLGVSKIDMFAMNKLIGQHLREPES